MLPSRPCGAANGGVSAPYHCATLVNNWEEERKTFGQSVPRVQTGAPLATETTTRTQHHAYSPADIIAARPPSYFTSETPRELLFHHGNAGSSCTVDQASVSELSYTDPRQHRSYHTDEVLDMTTVSQRQDATRARKMAASQCDQSTRGGAVTAQSDEAACADCSHAQSSDCNGANASLAATDDEATHAESHHSCSRSSWHAGKQTTCPSRGVNLSKEVESLRSLNRCHPHADTSAVGASRADTYTPPCLLPVVGRAAERERFVTTKQTTIDATAHYIREHPREAYPLTSSTCVAELTKSLDNPMRRTKLREEYELETTGRHCRDD